MRMLKKNKQKLHYSLFLEERPEYALDEFGNKIIEYVDEEGNISLEVAGTKYGSGEISLDTHHAV